MKSGPSTVVVTSLNAIERDTRIFQIAASFARFGYRSIVVEQEKSSISGDLPFELITLPGASPPPSADSVTNADAPSPRGLRLRVAADMRKLVLQKNEVLAEVLPSADLYYLNFFTEYPAVSKATEKHRAALIYESQDAHWAWPGYQEHPGPFRMWLRILERRAVRNSAEVVTVSDGVAEMYERRYGRRPTLLRNVHDLRIDQKADFDLRRTCGLEEGDFLVVVAGNDKPSDTIDEPLEAMTKVPGHVHLALMGRGWHLHAEEIRRLGLAGRVHVFPGVEPTKVTDTIARADAALINIRASDVHQHALPTRFFHSISAGIPVLYPPLRSVRELSERYKLGPPIDAEDADSIADAIRMLTDQPALTAKYRANVKRARRELNWETEEGHLAELAARAIRTTGTSR